MDPNNTLIPQSILDLRFRQIPQIPTADDFSERVLTTYGQKLSPVRLQTSQFPKDLLPVPETFTGPSTDFTVSKRFVACAFRPHSSTKEPSLSLLMLFRVPAIAWKPFCKAKGDSLLRSDSFTCYRQVITKYLGQLSSFMYSSLPESESELVMFRSYLLFVKGRRNHIWKKRNSPHVVLTHHRVQQGDALESGYPTGIISGL